MRNAQKDAVEMAEKRARMLKSGFELFSSRAIEPVTMQEIANASGIGIATIYRYFPSKLEFVIEIAVQRWKDFLSFVKEEDERIRIYDKTAAEQFAHYLDYYILLYREHRKHLRFNYDFNLYVVNSGATKEQMKEFTETVNGFAAQFATVYETGKRDGTLRTDIPADELFASSAHIMLAVATRYSAGLMFHSQKVEDDCAELEMLKDMIIEKFTVKTPSVSFPGEGAGYRVSSYTERQSI